MSIKRNDIIVLIVSVFFLVKSIHNFTRNLNSMLFVLNCIGLVLFSLLIVVKIRKIMLE